MCFFDEMSDKHQFYTRMLVHALTCHRLSCSLVSLLLLCRPRACSGALHTSNFRARDKIAACTQGGALC